MKIVSRDSIGLTIRFSWRELGRLRLMATSYRASITGLGTAFCKDRAFATALLRKLEIEEISVSDPSE